MLEKIHGVPQRIAALKSKLKARDGKKEYKENCVALRAEIERLENITLHADELREFVDGDQGAVASVDEAASVEQEAG